MEKQEEVFGIENLKEAAPFFRTKLGNFIGHRILKWCKIDRVNETDRRFCHLPPWEAAAGMMDSFGIKVEVENEHILDRFREGAFITISNHSYGAIDGISLCALIGRHRRDYKVMVNDILYGVKSLRENFIGVKPQVGYLKDQGNNMGGIKETIFHLRSKHPLCLFPAGAVSLYEGKKYLADREWQESVLKLIQKARVPVIPIYFHGYNSRIYYWLEHIHVSLRTILLPREVYNKKGKTLKITIGEPITVEEQKACKNFAEFGLMLRNRTYQLSGDPRLYTSDK